MSSIDKLLMRKIKDLEKTSKDHDKNINLLEKTSKDHDKNINLCYDLIEGIHILLDQNLGTNLKGTTPPHLKKGKTRKRGKSRKKGKSPRKKSRTRKVR